MGGPISMHHQPPIKPPTAPPPRSTQSPRAQTCLNPPKPATTAPAQNKPKCASQAGEVSRMKESHDQGLAHQIDPESCVVVREDASEALTGANAGRPYSLEKVAVPDADAHLGVRKATSFVSRNARDGGSGGAAEPPPASKHLPKTPPGSASFCPARPPPALGERSWG